MRLLYKIAIRNLFRHKGRSLSIGFILIVGAFFMTLGNGIIAGMQKGMEQNLVKTVFGDITLLPGERKQDTLSGQADVLEFIEEYESVQKAVSGLAYVDSITPIVFGKAATLDLSMTQSMSSGIETISLWGMDYNNYEDVYSRNVVIIEGNPLKKGERGILINASLRDHLYFMHDVWLLSEGGTVVRENLPAGASSETINLKTRDDLVLMGLTGSDTATDVRVPIKGIFKFKHLNEVLSLLNDEVSINFVDTATARDCMGFLNPEDRVTQHSPENQNLLDSAENDPGSLFYNDVVVVNGSSGKSFGNYEEVLRQDHVKPAPYTADNKIYSISQVNLSPDTDLDQAVEEINRSLIDSGFGKYVRAVSWQDAWAEFYGRIAGMRLSFTIFVNIIFFAAILMMTNAMSIAAVERTTEIGTMRTVGSRKGFIAGMFIMEISLLSFFFGGLGIIMGIAAIKLLSGMELTTTQVVLQIMYGGSRFSPLMDIDGVFSGIFQLGIITIIAAIYPVTVAKNIKPIDAIQCN